MSDAKCLVTFNGTMFDLKFIEKHIPGLKLPVAHVDLRFLARRVSWTGGQKAIEEVVGVERRKMSATSADGKLPPLVRIRRGLRGGR